VSEQSLQWSAQALAVVLDLPPTDLRADSPLDDLGVDSITRIQWADVVEELVVRHSRSAAQVQDSALAAAVTLGDLAFHLGAVTKLREAP
jgi:hypothetical protein